MKKIYGHLGAILVVIMWGTTFISSKKLLLEGMMPADIFFYRFLMAYICLLFLSHKQLWSKSVADELTMIGLGVMGGSLYFLTENMALIYSTTANVSIIVSSCPLLTALLLAIMYKSERMNSKQIIGSLIAFVGVILVVLNGQINLHLNPKGDILALVSALTWTLYSILMRRIMSRYKTVFITRKVFGYGILTIIPYFLLVEPLNTNVSVFTSPTIVSNLLFLGLVASTGGYLLWNWVMSKIGTMTATNYIYLQPLVTLTAGAVILNEKVTIMGIVGSIVLLLGTARAQKK
ncbi:MAG: DMT family transporter [Bacteroidaceae bacterium]|nr:DMT family transporter [Bacteroidaceae bacterium]